MKLVAKPFIVLVQFFEKMDFPHTWASIYFYNRGSPSSSPWFRAVVPWIKSCATDSGSAAAGSFPAHVCIWSPTCYQGLAFHELGIFKMISGWSSLLFYIADIHKEYIHKKLVILLFSIKFVKFFSPLFPKLF